MIIKVRCEMLKNVPMDGYIAIEGTNKLLLQEDDGKYIVHHIARVLWCGSGSPFPTPPGGPWSVEFLKYHKRFKECFYVHSDRESEIFIHFAQKKSYGCVIINPNQEGENFFKELKLAKDKLTLIQQEPIDSRTFADMKENPIDYTKMIKKIS